MLLQPEVQEFIRKNLRTDLTRLVLKGSPFKGVSAAELARQISSRRIAEKKLPTWFEAEGIIYPPRLNLEQTSSEVTATYKASLVQGQHLVDLTGGFGVDAHCFARKFKKITHCEEQAELSRVAAHNFNRLGDHHITSYTGDGLTFLKHAREEFDVLYLDPSRRDEEGGRVFRLADCQPQVPRHLDLFFSKSATLMIKTSPLLDLQLGIDELKNVQEIHIVAHLGEVKELLWILSRDQEGKQIQIHTRNFTHSGLQEFSGTFAAGAPTTFRSPQEYLYEPNAAIMKSGLFSALGQETGTSKLHPNAHLFTSSRLKEFPGRRFRVLEVQPFKPAVIRKKFRGEKAHLATRNFPEPVVNLRRQLRIREGGHTYIFFTTGPKEEKLAVICNKV